jgi:signal transduction histidine kinase
MARPQPAEMTPCTIQEELETIATLVAGEARDRQIKFVLQQPAAPVIVKGDGQKLRQAFLNIVINALQATPPGGSLTVSTTCGQAEGSAPLCESFRDTGTGIDAETLKRIFGLLRRSRDHRAGSGRNQKIIDAHGDGCLWRRRR